MVRATRRGDNEVTILARVDALAERANDGLVTPVERSEFEAFIDADDFIAVLKMKAQSASGRLG
jgi:hypothetical protein